MKLKLLDDEHAQGDNICLDFEGYAEAFVDLAMQTEESLTFGIFGEWGSGKTTLMRTIEQQFNGTNVYTVWFNPWEYPVEENMVKAMLHTMLNQEWFKKIIKNKSKIFDTIQSFLSAFTKKVPFVPDIDDLVKLVDEIKSKKESSSKFFSLRKTFEDFTGELTDGDEESDRNLLVFFIDDLDRCLPHRIVNMLENIRLAFSLKHTVFFIGADREIVADGIKYVYREHKNTEKVTGTDFDGDRYLEKMIQVPFFIPQNDEKKIKEYIKSFKFEKKDILFADILFELLSDVEANPRKIKRIINSIILSWTTYKTKTDNPEDSLDIKALAILKVIELKWLDFFRDLVEKTNNDRHRPLLNTIKDRREKYNHEQKIDKQPEEIKEICKDYNIKGGSFFEFFRKGIVGNLFEPKILDNLKMYLSSTKGFSHETESPLEDIESTSTIGQLIDFLWDGKVEEFNQLRKQSDYTNLNFSSENFTKLKTLEGVDFRNCSLTESNFKACKLNKAIFQNAILKGADFSGADCANADFTDAVMEMVNFKQAKLNGAVFKGTDLTGANWWDAENTDKVFSKDIKTKFKKPETTEEIDSWQEHFSSYHTIDEDDS
ncbi:MAG: pentapeptide repeat-containing protein [Candidatus Aminicenantes bacterium]|nr:pentapeptide repeat-containing protein [Candidatus Aminicenantes bacterium]